MDDPLTLRWYVALCYVYYGSKNLSEVPTRPLVHGTCHVLSKSSKEPLYESGIMDILSESPKEPPYNLDTLDYKGVTVDMTTMFAYV